MVKRKSALQTIARTSPSISTAESRGSFPKRNKALKRKGNEETTSIEDGGDASLHLTVVTPPPKTTKRSNVNSKVAVNRVTAPYEDIGIPRLVCLLFRKTQIFS
jgi:hypothetical protein